MATFRTAKPSVAGRRASRDPRREWRATTLTGARAPGARHGPHGREPLRRASRSAASATTEQVLAYIANPAIFTIESLFLVVVTVHAMLGLRGVLLDLDPGPRRAPVDRPRARGARRAHARLRVLPDRDARVPGLRIGAAWSVSSSSRTATRSPRASPTLARQMGGEDVRDRDRRRSGRRRRAPDRDRRGAGRRGDRARVVRGRGARADGPRERGPLRRDGARVPRPGASREGASCRARPFVEGAVAAAVAAKLGRPLESVADEARGGLAGKAAHLEDDRRSSRPGRHGDGRRRPTQGDPRSGSTIVVDLPHGLHARPAARLVQTAGAVRRRRSRRERDRRPRSGERPQPQRRRDARRRPRDSGSRSSPAGRRPTLAIDAVRALAARRFDEAPRTGSSPSPRPTPAVASRARRGGAIVGASRPRPGSPSDPRGDLHVPDAPAGRRSAPARPRRKRARSGRARSQPCAATSRRQRDAAARRAGHGRGRDLRRAPPLPGGRGAARADAGRRSRGCVARRRHGPTPSTRLAAQLGGARRPLPAGASRRPPKRRATGARADCWVSRRRTAALGTPGILVVADLEPADTVALDPRPCRGIAAAHGGPTSHAAVLARALGIPAVVGLGEPILGVDRGTCTLGLDGGDRRSSTSTRRRTIVARLEARRAERRRATPVRTSAGRRARRARPRRRRRRGRARTSVVPLDIDGRASPPGATAWGCSAPSSCSSARDGCPTRTSRRRRIARRPRRSTAAR